MESYKEQWRWGGWRLGALFCLILTVASERVISYRSNFLLAWAPSLGLGWYLALVVWVNRTKLLMDRDGVTYLYGPLPSGARNRTFPIPDIKRLYVRSYVDSSAYGGAYRSVGIETKSGYAFDLLREELPALTIEERARAMGKYLRWAEAAERIDGPLPGRPLQSWVSWAPFVSAAMVSGCWVLWVFR